MTTIEAVSLKMKVAKLESELKSAREKIAKLEEEVLTAYENGRVFQAILEIQGRDRFIELVKKDFGKFGIKTKKLKTKD